MQAIIDADYSYTPAEYWKDISPAAMSFIDCSLVVDPEKRQTAHKALQHPWITGKHVSPDAAANNRGVDLLPNVRKNFNARVKLHAAIDTIRAINQLRAGQGIGAKMMDGARSAEPAIKNMAAAARAAVGGGGVSSKLAETVARNATPVHEGTGNDGIQGTGQLWSAGN
jgi:calcium/calmodulin-dependent protein kinase I